MYKYLLNEIFYFLFLLLLQIQTLILCIENKKIINNQIIYRLPLEK